MQSHNIQESPPYELRILISDVQMERSVRVTGDMHIGAVMLKLVENLSVSNDWSDFALWWPKKNTWLTKTRHTLNYYGIQADSFLHFTTMHKVLRVQLPDLRSIDAKVDFSVSCFSAVKLLCKELGIRYSEELSFCKPLSTEHLKKNHQNIIVTPKQRVSAVGPTGLSKAATIDSRSMVDTRSRSPDITSTLSRHASYRGFTSTYDKARLIDDLKNIELTNRSHLLSSEARESLLYPRDLIEKARLNSGWLDSHLSLFQQNVQEFDNLQLRFKLINFFDLNPKLDIARIHQIYEQARLSLMTREIECHPNQMSVLGELQYQVQQMSDSPIIESIEDSNNDIDEALNQLENLLEGRTKSSMSATELKLKYIDEWLKLPGAGIHKFVVKFGESDREEILGIARDRLIRIDARNGRETDIWPLSKLKTWRVNWDKKQVLLEFQDSLVSITPLSASCKIPHEFIGGYVFLSMRNINSSQIDERLFYKLTRGWDD